MFQIYRELFQFQNSILPVTQRDQLVDDQQQSLHATAILQDM